jgi:hypothetical protein
MPVQSLSSPMRRRGAAALATLVALLAFTVTSDTAWASKLSVTNQNFRVVWTPLTIFGDIEDSDVECNVTVEGVLHSRTIQKVALALIGVITRAAVARPCTGLAEVWVLNGIEMHPTLGVFGTSLPWHVRYRSFRGTLPAINGVTVDFVNVGFVAETLFGGLCLYRSTTEEPLEGTLEIGADGTITGFRNDERVAIPKAVGERGCFGAVYAKGTGTVTLTGTATPIRITLIR